VKNPIRYLFTLPLGGSKARHEPSGRARHEMGRARLLPSRRGKPVLGSAGASPSRLQTALPRLGGSLALPPANGAAAARREPRPPACKRRCRGSAGASPSRTHETRYGVARRPLPDGCLPRPRGRRVPLANRPTRGDDMLPPVNFVTSSSSFAPRKSVLSRSERRQSQAGAASPGRGRPAGSRDTLDPGRARMQGARGPLDQ